MPLKRFPLSIPCGCVRHGDPTTAIINETFASRNKSVGAHIRSGKELKIGDVLKKRRGMKMVKCDFLVSFGGVPSVNE